MDQTSRHRVVIVAGGVRQSYFGHDEFAHCAPGMKTLADALSVRRRVFSAFEMAETVVDTAERRRMLTFALVGAGPTGVELAGQIRELATRTLRAEFHHIRPEHARVLLFDAGHAPLAALDVKPACKAPKALQELT
jgi:NADH dehydrogenase